MPGIGFNSKNLKTARRMLEHCRFAYKAYAQGCRYPMDPFYESHGEGLYQGARDRLMSAVHKSLGTSKNEKKFDPIEYVLDQTPNPSKGVVYRGGTDNKYILFQPRPLDKSIGRAIGFDVDGNRVGEELTIPHGGSLICCYFQGRTGMTQTHPDAGWTSWLGAVIFDPRDKSCVIVFRGSRSGAGGRALAQAQFKSIGSPDWVTDMNHVKETAAIGKYNDAKLACGFYYAYESCKKSLQAAYLRATRGSTPAAVYVTGHSLGGALAQCAYLDIVMGEMAQTVFLSGGGMSDNVPIVCFPISAPPIVLGRESHKKIALDADATQILHYYCTADCVHDSPLIENSVMKFGSWVLAAGRHPLTDPLHIGTEIGLSSPKSFPDAHEPEEVWKAMNAGISDPHFWPTFTFHHLEQSGTFVANLPTGLEDDVKTALRASISSTTTLARSQQWLDVTKDELRALQVLQSKSELFDPAIGLINDLSSPQCTHRTRKMAQLKEIRKRLVNGYSSASNHKASSSCYWVFLQYLTAGQVWLNVT